MAKKYTVRTFCETRVWAMIRSVYSSPAMLTVIPLQDILGLDNSARMNVPSTMGGNWIWRMKKNACGRRTARKLKALSKIYFR